MEYNRNRSSWKNGKYYQKWYKVVVKHSLTETNNISKSNKEPSIKIISGVINKPKIINDGKQWNVEN